MKALFREIQTRNSGNKAKQYVNTFVYEIRMKEKNLTKRAGFDRLKPSPVERATDLLACAEMVQHAFSSDNKSTLHLAIPALEALHRAWTSRLTRPMYSFFTNAITNAKVDEYLSEDGYIRCLCVCQ